MLQTEQLQTVAFSQPSNWTFLLGMLIEALSCEPAAPGAYHRCLELLDALDAAGRRRPPLDGASFGAVAFAVRRSDGDPGSHGGSGGWLACWLMAGC